jgi:hypothetical protein
VVFQRLAFFSLKKSLCGMKKSKICLPVLGINGYSANLLEIGYKFLKDKSLKLGYAMDYVIQAQAAKQKTSQEFMLSYTLPAISGGGKKVVRTPRFRH